MALPKNFSAGEELTASDLNSNFDHLENNKIDAPESPSDGEYLKYDNSTSSWISGAVASIQAPTVVEYTANGNFNPADYPNLKYVVVHAHGGGGGGGSNATNPQWAIGGAGGGYARGIVTAADINTTIAVTVGAGGTHGTPANAGGTSSFGSFVEATGGAGSPGTHGNNFTTGGTGAGNALDFKLPGGRGQPNFDYGRGGMGAQGPWPDSPANGSSRSGQVPGGGGSGGYRPNTAGPRAGGNGARGYVLVEVYE